MKSLRSQDLDEPLWPHPKKAVSVENILDRIVNDSEKRERCTEDDNEKRRQDKSEAERASGFRHSALSLQLCPTSVSKGTDRLSP